MDNQGHLKLMLSFATTVGFFSHFAEIRTNIESELITTKSQQSRFDFHTVSSPLWSSKTETRLRLRKNMTKTQPRTTLQRSVTRPISCFFGPLQHEVDLNGQSRSLGMIKVCNLLFAVLHFAVFSFFTLRSHFSLRKNKIKECFAR